MKLNVKVILFIFISFFSICIAADFWTKLNWDYETRDIFYSSQDEIYISAYNESSYIDEYRSLDDGLNWEYYTEILDYPTHCSLKQISEDGQYLYVLHRDSLYIYDLYIVHKDSSNLKKILELNFMSMHKIKNDFFFLKANQIYKSTLDFNDAKLVLETEGAEPFFAIVSDSIGTLWAGSTNYFGGGGLYKSINNGETWEGPESDLYGEFIRDIAVDSEGRIFIGTAGGSQGTGIIYRSIDNGETWEKVVYHYIHTNKIVINSDDEIFAGLENGRMIYSNDHGDSWEYIDGGLVNPGMINDMVISPHGHIYIATNDGVYRSVHSTTRIDNSENLISGVELYQNYPNPFNNETIINYNLNKSCQVQLNIFNSKGELIKNIKNQKMSKGHHSVNLKADNFGSGIYYYSLKVDNKTVSTKKMLYIR